MYMYIHRTYSMAYKSILADLSFYEHMKKCLYEQVKKCLYEQVNLMQKYYQKNIWPCKFQLIAITAMTIKGKDLINTAL